jgi:beta-lactam-binding protein with PASTA domain/predicted Ser/Thr protein kinase
MRVLAGRYELLEKVGEGGMSVVWRARDTRLERDVAVKLLRSFVAIEPEQRRRFAREARTLAALSNDHIVRLYDYAEAGDDAFLVMEFVDGSNLAERTFTRLPLPWSEAAAYARPVCSALAYAHAKGVVHRDLTPANILIERETGRVVTTDFGLARIARSGGSLTTVGTLVGTPEYWSPEQALGRESGSSSDMYALGCILYLLLSGRLPFEGDDRLALGLRRAHEDPLSLRELAHVPEGAATLVDSLLRRDPSRRPDAPTAALAMAEAAQLRTIRLERRTATREPDAPTAVLASKAAPEEPGPTLRIAPTTVVRPRRRLLLLAATGAAAAAAMGVLAAARFEDHGVRAPSVVRWRAAAARTRILRTMPTATVSVRRVYSTRVEPNRVIRQQPAPRERIEDGVAVTLTVSKGSPFAEVPAVAAGTPAAAARTVLRRNGFRVRYRYTPSWSVRKGTVIELQPGSGTRVRRPATMRVIVSSGFPRAVVPDVRNVDLETARTQLEAKRLRYAIVYRTSQTSVPNQVVEQHPSPRTVVYEGRRVWLAVTRVLRWRKVFAYSGTGAYESAPFDVSWKWRIRYRLDGDGFWGVTTEFAWARDGDFFRDGSFVGDTAGALQVHDVSEGAGTYRLTVRPYFRETSWYVEVDSLE